MTCLVWFCHAWCQDLHLRSLHSCGPGFPTAVLQKPTPGGLDMPAHSGLCKSGHVLEQHSNE